ncbi:chemotaxis protein CheX [Clostridium cylindrosporum]|uniref:Inhibitor of MCP methylation n=1 Tax=Clostridium cylindrosporum DSM 605 TaxID=1121307 RepID=A0A0J8D7K4_CLOCY|nr:chemotaxis protein CheX [Clostridium cylindrosporum]KMT22010.1 inhibitor of MCP methylation [Clostridium cylindrosporum DSM 605]
MDRKLIEAFTVNILEIFDQMIGIKIEAEKEINEDSDSIVSYGVSSIVSYTGELKGRLLLDMEANLAISIAKCITGEEFSDEREDMVLASVSELNNIIAGSAITQLNNDLKLKLRLAPPVVFAGKGAVVSIPKINSISEMYISPYGKLKINIAFEGGLD